MDISDVCTLLKNSLNKRTSSPCEGREWWERPWINRKRFPLALRVLSAGCSTSLRATLFLPLLHWKPLTRLLGASQSQPSGRLLPGWVLASPQLEQRPERKSAWMGSRGGAQSSCRH